MSMQYIRMQFIITYTLHVKEQYIYIYMYVCTDVSTYTYIVSNLCRIHKRSRKRERFPGSLMKGGIRTRT